MGNGLSYPLWFSKMMQVFDWFYPEIPLVVACDEGNYEAVCDLLENGADPNYSVDGYTWTAIYIQSCEGKSWSLNMKCI